MKSFLRRVAVAACLVCLVGGAPSRVAAEGISAYAELNYSLIDTTTKDQTGSSKSSGSSLQQRYNLTLDKSFYPTLRLFAGGIFERVNADSETDGITSTSEATKILPTVDLSMNNPVIGSGIGFSRREESSTTQGVSSPTLFFDSYNGRINWKPQDFPSLDILYSRFDNYDENRTGQDSTAETYNVSSRYKPVQGLDMNYQANFTSLTDKLNLVESQSQTHGLRTVYSDVFFKDLLTVSSSYNIAYQSSTTTATGTKAGQLPPEPKAIDTLYRAATTLLDNPLTTPAFTSANAQSTLNQLIAGPSVSAVPDRENLGMKFTLSPSVNIIRLSTAIVTRSPGYQLTLPDYARVNALFNGRIRLYTSTTGDAWTLVDPTRVTVSFGSFTNQITGQPSLAFQLQFPSVTPANYLKVEIVPVANDPIVDIVQTISVTRVEAFLQPEKIIPRSTQLAGIYDLNLKARLASVPIVYYDMSFTLNHEKGDETSSVRYMVVNGLSLNHRFNRIFSTTGRLAREDAGDQAGKRSSNSLSVSLMANPLPTLTHSLTYSFRQDNDPGNSRTQQSIFVANSAELYRGANVSLTGGWSSASDSTGIDQKNLLATMGVNLQPHKSVGINMSLTNSQGWTTGGGKPDQYTFTRTGDFSLTYNPIQSIYLFGGYTLNAQNGRELLTTQNFGGSWSPFRDGALVLNVSYREALDNVTKERTLTQSVRWNIRPGSYLDVSYLITSSDGSTQNSDTQSFNTSLRMSY